METVIIDFQADYTSLDGAIDALSKAGIVDQQMANAFKTTNAEVQKQTTLLNKEAKTVNDITKNFGSLNKASSTFITEFAKGWEEGVNETLEEAGVKFEDVQKELARLSKEGKVNVDVLSKLETENGKLSKRLEDVRKGTNAVGTTATSARARLKSMREELLNLADQGLENTQRFKELQKEAGKLADDIGDVQARINATGSDTRVFDGLISAAQGITAGFAVAQGAVALFGDESEEVQKTLLKVNSAMAILQGLQQIQQTLQKESAASLLFLNNAQKANVATTALATAAESKNIIVKGAAVVATKALNAAIALSNPITLAVVAVIVAVTAAYKFFTAASKEAEEQQKALNNEMEQTAAIGKELEEGLKKGQERNIALLKTRGATEKQIRQQQLKDLEEIAAEAKSREERFAARAEEAMQKLRTSTDEKEIERLQKTKKTYEDFQQARIDAEQEVFLARQSDIQATSKEEDEALKKRQDNLKKALADERQRLTEAAAARKEQLEQAIAGYQLEQRGLDENSYAWKNLQKEINNSELAIANIDDTLKQQLSNLESGIKKAIELTNKQRLNIAKTAEENKKLFTPDLQALDAADKTLAERYDAFGQKRIDSAKAISDAEKTIIDSTEQYEAAVQAKRQENYEKFVKGVQEKSQLITDIYNQISSSLNAILNEQERNQQIALDNKKKEVAAQLEAGQITEQQAKARNIRIENEEKKMKIKQAQRDKQMAIFQAIIATAQAVVKSLAVGLPVGAVLAGIAAGLGAAQVAFIAARPLPKFSRGKKDGYEGPGIVGEAGSELRVDADGRMRQYDKPTVTWIGKKDRIYSHMETLKIMNTPKVHKADSPGKERNHQETIDYDKLGKAVASNIPSQPSINITSDFVEVAVARGLSKAKYFDKHYTFKR